MRVVSSGRNRWLIFGSLVVAAAVLASCGIVLYGRYFPSKTAVSSSPSGVGAESSGSVHTAPALSSALSSIWANPLKNVSGEYTIAEVTTYQAETFYPDNLRDTSSPQNSYLPAGTVDYCGANDILATVNGEQKQYRLLRYGKMVYVQNPSSGTNIKVYKGSLPSANHVSIASVKEDSRFTTITLNTDWKAPFTLELAPQSYVGPGTAANAPNFGVTDVTYDQVQIQFCYASSGSGKMGFAADSVLSGGSWSDQKDGYTLTLKLRQTGKFYGWNASYDSNGHLIFTFLKPVQTAAADNTYGWSLKGATVMLDPGHGGSDIGAPGSDPKYPESVLNLALAKVMRTELQSIGANVLMTRTADTRITLNTVVRTTKAAKPDIFVSVHHNASVSTSLNGYANYYYTPFSKALGNYVNLSAKDLYKINEGCNYYPYYVTRLSDCPAILTENGYMSNPDQYAWIVKTSTIQKQAKANVQGIVNYFKSIKR